MNRMKKMGVRHVVLLIMFLLSGALFAQEEVRGKVVDANGEPVPGVTVLEKGTTNGVATDIDGLFIMQINSKEAVLSFSFIGFQTKDLLAVGDLSLVILALEDRLIDELVVVGFKTQKKVNLTGSVSSVTSEILESKPVVNAAQALQGTMPGLIIQEDNSSPTSSGPSINIRGVGTFGSTSPLVLIDGIVGSFSNVNPSDIASISVLKDASSAAIYGSRGANGVILITTKKNAGGEGAIHYTMNYGWQNATDLPEYASSWEYAMMRNEALVNSGLAPKFTPEQIQGYKDGPEITPWIEEIYREAAPQVNHNLSIAGGTKELGYLLSLGYQSQESLFDAKDLGLKRYNGRLSINSQVKEYLKVEGSMAFSRRDISDHSYWTDWLIEQSTRMPTIYPIIDENNNYTLASGSNSNALARLREGGRTTYLYDEYTTNLSAELTLPYQFSLKGVFGGYVRNNNQHLFRKSIDYSPYSGGGDAEEVVQDNNQKETYLNNQLLLNYDNVFAKKHKVSGMLGASSESSTWTNFQARKIGVPGNENGVLSNGELTDEAGTNGSGGTWGINSLFGRVNYGYDDRYLFEVNFRYDQSSRFSASNRDAFFPSFSGAWRVNQEQFMQQTEDWLSNLKFRASWGLVGNQEIGLYQYLPTVVLNNYAYSYGNKTATGAYFTDVNEDISWETSRIIDFGVDLGFFKNELSFTFDYFNKLTNDILLYLPVPSTYGGGSPVQNAGTVQNYGWEFSGSWNKNIGNFSNVITFNLSDNVNEIIEMGANNGQVSGTDVVTINKEGYAINSFYAYKSNGFFQNDAEVAAGPTPVFATSVKPGDIRYVNKNPGADNVIDDKDRFIIGNSFPRYLYGMDYSAEYKTKFGKIDARIFVQGVGKRMAWIRGEASEAFHNNNEGPVMNSHLNRWTPGNTAATYPRLTLGSESTNNAAKSDFWIHDVSYLRLKNVQVGYSLPSSLLDRINVEKLRVYVSGHNLFTKTDMVKGYDPEVYSGSSTSGRVYPVNRVLSLGLDLKF